jgi:hypothetical protein
MALRWETTRGVLPLAAQTSLQPLATSLRGQETAPFQRTVPVQQRFSYHRRLFLKKISIETGQTRQLKKFRKSKGATCGAFLLLHTGNGRRPRRGPALGYGIYGSRRGGRCAGKVLQGTLAEKWPKSVLSRFVHPRQGLGQRDGASSRRSRGRRRGGGLVH